MHSTKEILGIKTFFAVEQPVKLFWIFIRNRHIANSQIRKLCKEAVLFHIQANCYHINDCVTAFFAAEREFSAIRPGVQSYPQEYALHSVRLSQ